MHIDRERRLKKLGTHPYSRPDRRGRSERTDRFERAERSNRRSKSPPSYRKIEINTQEKVKNDVIVNTVNKNIIENKKNTESKKDEERKEKKEDKEGKDVTEESESEENTEDISAMMGFGGFGSTKNKKVIGNNVGGIAKVKKSKYRQYMNRIGGFNRPLSP